MRGDTPGQAPPLARTLVALVLFGLAFGYMEGAVVVNLRALYDPIHWKLKPESGPGDLFPILSLDELRSESPKYLRYLVVELVREAATLVMLAAVPWLYARNVRQWIAGFMIGFGVWDLAYYATLKLILDWPDSIVSWDLLFLLPVPWSGPVLAPVLVSISIIGAGIFLLYRESIGQPITLGIGSWSLIVLGGLIVVLSFCWEARTLMAGGRPESFPWWFFGSGESLGLLTFGWACRFDRRKASSIEPA